MTRAHLPSLRVIHAAGKPYSGLADVPVGAVGQPLALDAMTAEQLTARAAACAARIETAQAMLDSGDSDFFAAAGERDYWRLAMEEALRERAKRADAVAAMELARGLT